MKKIFKSVKFTRDERFEFYKQELVYATVRLYRLADEFKGEEDVCAAEVQEILRFLGSSGEFSDDVESVVEELFAIAEERRAKKWKKGG